MIGAEGTLGVVTAAAVKLFPILASRAVAIAGLRSVADAGRLLVAAKSAAGLEIEAFELVCGLGMDLVVEALPGARAPLAGRYPWYVLIEIASARPGAAEAAMERLLSSAAETALIEDAVVAQSEAQAAAFWALREGQSAAQKSQGAAWKHDVSVPLSRIPHFIDEATRRLEGAFPGVRVDAFGHMGDGNIHFDVLGPKDGDQPAHAAARDAGARLVHGPGRRTRRLDQRRTWPGLDEDGGGRGPEEPRGARRPPRGPRRDRSRADHESPRAVLDSQLAPPERRRLAGLLPQPEKSRRDAGAPAERSAKRPHQRGQAVGEGVFGEDSR